MSEEGHCMYRQCKHCDNPHGKCVIGFTPQRKCAKHEWQAQINMSNTEFAKGKEKELSGGSPTIVEFFTGKYFGIL